MHTCILEEIWYDAVYAQGIIPQTSAQGLVVCQQPCGVDTVIGGKTMRIPSADTQECCHKRKLKHTNQGRNN